MPIGLFALTYSGTLTYERPTYQFFEIRIGEQVIFFALSYERDSRYEQGTTDLNFFYQSSDKFVMKVDFEKYCVWRNISHNLINIGCSYILTPGRKSTCFQELKQLYGNTLAMLRASSGTSVDSFITAVHPALIKAPKAAIRD
ncbi:hypothetical protein RF11_10072 [Thelohanellus kitauei]|uniref:Uncharacterized protein n=1 Tax=Thelohanellus kitauei TaxID=669202 RepID=A0A0C2M7J3_THEKT|nr:hypothetical protein RF11_10072 [Thelohanellus kitauei]